MALLWGEANSHRTDPTQTLNINPVGIFHLSLEWLIYSVEAFVLASIIDFVFTAPLSPNKRMVKEKDKKPVDIKAAPINVQTNTPPDKAAISAEILEEPITSPLTVPITSQNEQIAEKGTKEECQARTSEVIDKQRIANPKISLSPIEEINLDYEKLGILIRQLIGKILLIFFSPFKKLSPGYYRLFAAGWLLFPLGVSFLLYAIISLFGHTGFYPDGIMYYEASDISLLWFFILLVAYYPIARIILWVWEGFHAEKK